MLMKCSNFVNVNQETFKEKLNIFETCREIMADFLHSAIVMLRGEWLLKKVILTQVMTEKNKEGGWGLTIFTIEVNGQTCTCN